MLDGCGLLDCLRRGERDKHDAGRTDSRVSDEPSGAGGSAAGKSGRVRRLEWAEVESVTGGFSSRVIGQGGFSTVYLASLSSSRLGAVKVQRSSERLLLVFRQELDVLMSVRHPHIVRLLGYCDEREEGVLVFEYAANGDLHERLHREVPKRAPLPWARRMAIAFQVAMALEYLHESRDPAVIHGDIKASNVLLDASLDAKLCDFGFAHVGFSAAVRPAAATTARASARHVMGSPGYLDPHLLRSGVPTKKSDVYSFGVLMLELVTGREAMCADTGCRLTAAVGPTVSEGKVADVVDRRLGDMFDREEAATVGALALQCTNVSPGLRPSMADVVRVLQEKTSALIAAVGPKPVRKMVS
ncbi:hypothetical protein ACQ4PT_005401 [Festuca glaucescens]